MPLKRPLVSVITPVYNGEKYIKDAINSIRTQTFRNYEYIVIDDKSNDNTLKIINNFSKRDKRIKIYQNNRNLGIAGNRNKGIRLAKGKYIAWQDADDISLPDRLKKEVEFLENNSNVGIIGGYLLFFNNQGDLSIRKYPRTDDTARRIIFRYCPIGQPSVMIRRECFKKVGMYDLKYPPAEDLEFYFRLGKKYKFANIPSVLVKYRLNETSATYTNIKRMEKLTLAIRKKNYSNKSFNYGFFDKIYNLVQRATYYIVPSKIRMFLFNIIRNSVLLRVE